MVSRQGEGCLYVLALFLDSNLSLDTEEFRSFNPTAENIAIVIWERLRLFIDDDKKLEV